MRSTALSARLHHGTNARLQEAIMAALRAAGIGEEVEISLQNGTIVLTRPDWHPRAGWAEAIEAAGQMRTMVRLA